MPLEHTGLGVDQVDILPLPRRDIDNEDDVTFDTFKRRGKSQEKNRGTIPEFENQSQAANTPQAANKLLPTNTPSEPKVSTPYVPKVSTLSVPKVSTPSVPKVSTPSVPKVSTPSPQAVVESMADRGVDIPNSKTSRMQLPLLEIHTVKQDVPFKITTQQSTPVEEAYYETVTLTTEDDTYDNLDHQTPIIKQSIGSLNEYSQLHNYPQSPTAPQLMHAYSMVTIRTTRTPSSPPPAPPSLSPSYNGLELLGPRSRYSTDILQSSWSKPSMMDQVTTITHMSQQLDAAQGKGSQQLEIYDYPTAMTSTTKPPIARERKKGVVKILTGDKEVIYDIPPSTQ